MFFSTLVSVVEGLVPAVVMGGMLVVFTLILLPFVLFATEWLPINVTAIVMMALLMVLEPWMQTIPQEGPSGFVSPTAITVLMMPTLSTGANRTGTVQLIGRRTAKYVDSSQTKQLAATIGVIGPVSGFINNTPVVTILVSVVADLAHKGKTSPSKLLMPLLFASMLGDTLTVIGTSMNIFASNIAAQLGRGSPGLNLHAFGMFEFIKLGVIILMVGAVYLVTVGVHLLSRRVPAGDDLLEEYAFQEYLADVVVPASSSLIGQAVQEALGGGDFDIDVLQLIRYGKQFLEPLTRKEIHGNNTLRLRTSRETLGRTVRSERLTFVGGPRSESKLHPGEEESAMVEVVIPPSSLLVGESPASSTLRQYYDTSVLTFRTRGEIIRDRSENISTRVGDTLLVQAPPSSPTRLVQDEDLIVIHEFGDADYRTERTPFAVAIITGVVAPLTFNVPPIVVSAFRGVAAMILTDAPKPNELYESAKRNVISLLAGVIPLGVALQWTGVTALLGDVVTSTATFLPAIGVLWVFYPITRLSTSAIPDNASIVLMIPIAARAVQSVGANTFVFILVVTFVVSTTFMTPAGYQANLFVYGPNGYTFSDFLRVDASLQLLLSIVTVAGIAFF